MNFVNHPPRPEPGQELSLGFALKNSLHVHYFAKLANQGGKCWACGGRPDSTPFHLHRARPGVDTSLHPISADDWVLVCAACHPRAEAILFQQWGPALYGCADVGVEDENAS